MEVCVILFFSVGKLLLLVWVLSEMVHTLLGYLQKWRKIRAGELTDNEDKKVREFLEFGGDMEDYEQIIRHKFLKKDELFFLDAVRLSPFPEEALAQLHTFVDHDDLSACDLLSAADFLFEKGHIELQGQTLYVVIPRISCMYSDLTYDISTSSEFAEEMMKLLSKVASTLKIESQVKERLAVAKTIREKYKVVGRKLHRAQRARRRRGKRRAEGRRGGAEEDEEEDGLAAGDEDEDWRRLLGGATSADVQLQWLRMRMHPEENEKVQAKKRAEFTLLFPSAKPACRQEAEEEDEEEEEVGKETEGEGAVLSSSPGFFEKVANAIFLGAPSAPSKAAPPPRLPPDPLDVQLHPTKALDLLEKRK